MVARHVPKPVHAKWTMEYLPGRGWRLVDPEGAPGTAFYQKDRAITALDLAQARTDAARGRKTRPCLCCGTDFQSEGIHNRMCNDCRQRDMAPDPLSRHAFQKRTAA